ncbi:carbonic anhydrase [Phlegmacium glaucopus]|nr:carbonic anhydrase [Phlegmacium glaucopus]
MGSKIFQRGHHGGYAPEIEELYHGNKAYIANMSETNPGLLQSLASDGQKPPFMVVDCSDSRVNEQGIFSAEPGTMFTAGNIANQFDEDDLNSNAVLSYAVETLKVKHVIVMGHYGCGGIAASMVPPPEHEGPTHRSASLAVQNWISPIRQIYQTSTRSEIVAHRTKCTNASHDQNMPDLHDPAFRALVEENVKANVFRIARSAVMQEHYTSIAQRTTTTAKSEPVTGVYIHGWVYDVESGEVSDLGVSVGPPGKVVPPTPFPTIKP